MCTISVLITHLKYLRKIYKTMGLFTNKTFKMCGKFYFSPAEQPRIVLLLNTIPISESIWLLFYLHTVTNIIPYIYPLENINILILH